MKGKQVEGPESSRKGKKEHLHNSLEVNFKKANNVLRSSKLSAKKVIKMPVSVLIVKFQCTSFMQASLRISLV